MKIKLQKRVTKMKVTKFLQVPYKFFKKEYFEVSKNELLLFLTHMKGFVDREGDVHLLYEVDIEQTIFMHTGDCRIWLKGDNGYIVPHFKYLFMIVEEKHAYINDIYEWMELYTPSLYFKHVAFDRMKKENEE